MVEEAVRLMATWKPTATALLILMLVAGVANGLPPQVDRFYELAELGEQLNFLARDGESMTVLIQALDDIGVWDSREWWHELPAEGLTSYELDAFRWQVYRALLTLDGLYVKRLGIELGGTQDGSVAGVFTLMRRYMTTEAGYREAEAAIEIGKRIQAFRPSQTAKWYTGTAQFRLKQAYRAKASDLGRIENAADGYSLGLLCLIAQMDPSFRTWFSGYGMHLAEDGVPPSPLETMRLTLEQTIELDPDHYWTHLILGHTLYWLGDEAIAAGDMAAATQHLSRSLVEADRCVSMRPDLPFAMSDRATVRRRLAMARGDDQAHDVLEASLRDASAARELSPHSDWVHWHEGLALIALQRDDDALESFHQAVQLGFEYGLTTDSLRIRVDDLRGRLEAIKFAKSRIESATDPRPYRALLAAMHYSRGDLESAANAIDDGATDAVSRTVAGWLELRNNHPEAAKRSFERALAVVDVRSSTTWTHMGLARAQLELNELANALANFRAAANASDSPQIRASAWLGVSQTQWRLGQNNEAMRAVDEAQSAYVACNLDDLSRRAVLDWRSFAKAAKHADAKERAELEERAATMKHLLERLSERPMASPKRVLESIRPPSN